MNNRRVDVLGVPVDAIDMAIARDQIRKMLAGDKNNLVFAVNPEKVMAAREDPRLLKALQAADMLIPDGIGVVIAARLLHKSKIDRVPGSELMPEICRIAAELRLGVFLYGAKPKVVERASKILIETYPGLKIAGTQHGYVLEKDMDALIATINSSGAAVLFVATGSPRQEFWMTRYRHQLSVRACQGVGGTFDALCGNPPRAPMLIRKLHLEWLYRLVTQPHRAHRQKTLPRFAMQVVRARMRNDDRRRG